MEFDITNEELANAANITPYTASRILSDWQKTLRPNPLFAPALQEVISVQVSLKDKSNADLSGHSVPSLRCWLKSPLLHRGYCRII